MASRGIKAAIVPVLDEYFLASPSVRSYLTSEAWRQLPMRLVLACAVTPAERGLERLRRSEGLPVGAVYFHPLLQEIGKERYRHTRKIAKLAERQGRFVVVSCGYGTRHLYRYEGLRVLLEIAQHVRCPIVVGHAGGLRVLEACLIAADHDQVLIETSFTLPYYLGSSVEQDLAFAMRSLGCARWMFGSDDPFIPLEKAKRTTIDFMKRHGFSVRDISQVMSRTADRLLGNRTGRFHAKEY